MEDRPTCWNSTEMMGGPHQVLLSQPPLSCSFVVAVLELLSSTSEP